MEALIIFSILIAVILFMVSKKLKSMPDDQLTPGNKKFLNAENNLKDTVQIGYDRIKKATQKKVTEQYLIGGNWYLDNKLLNLIYTFRSGGELLITENGIVKKGQYEFIVDSNSIIITSDGISKMFHIENLKNDIFVLQDLSDNRLITFYNQTKIKDKIVKEINREEKVQEEVKYQSTTDIMVEWKEALSSPIYKAIEEENMQRIRITSKISNNSNGLFGVINELKNETKENDEIMEDFENWSNGNSSLTLMHYLFFLDDQQQRIL